MHHTPHTLLRFKASCCRRAVACLSLGHSSSALQGGRGDCCCWVDAGLSLCCPFEARRSWLLCVLLIWLLCAVCCCEGLGEETELAGGAGLGRSTCIWSGLCVYVCAFCTMVRRCLAGKKEGGCCPQAEGQSASDHTHSLTRTHTHLQSGWPL